ncbi:MAG: hypothetical protein CMM16_01580 [Rhodospirillaceae bacterium]|nr:hypothetical protein [Rhodospirillaceae bacterium]|tara:strand:- start:521 stop:988 length:468 start_codon:yes stop_codon:yes gene_type:complete
MQISVFVPPDGPVPVVTWLAGLACTEDNFTTKAGAYGIAAELGLMVVAPDTSPRNDDVPDDDTYDLGQGAGFYLDATQAPWATHFNMYSYITHDLPSALKTDFPSDWKRQGVLGHSMAATPRVVNPATGLQKSILRRLNTLEYIYAMTGGDSPSI